MLLLFFRLAQQSFIEICELQFIFTANQLLVNELLSTAAVPQ